MRHSPARRVAWLAALTLGLACSGDTDRTAPLSPEAIGPSESQGRRLPHEEASAALAAVLAGNAQTISCHFLRD